MDWMAIGERFGLPGLILFVLCVWLRGVSLFVAPLVRDMVKSHLGLITTVSKELESQTRLSRRQTSLLKNQGELLKNQGEMLKSLQSNFDRKEKAA
jgi:hypothetical protein